ncbi:MAG TPA: carboxylesterase family protein [Terracidiphilus sp.]
MKRYVTSVVAACMMALALSAHASSAPVVNTTYGPVKGILTPGVAEFLGVRYAASTAGKLRWTPPQPPARWSAPVSAARFGNACPQTAFPFPAIPTGEDCLFLNVYVPTSQGTAFFGQDQGEDQGQDQDQPRFPVMIWIHGGSLVQGAGNFYDPTPLVKNGNVIVVTINYRLGALGFLAHPALSAETSNGGSGNYGLMDQQFALNWVKRNIAAFGGDPHNVTIFGESASILSHIASPTAAGLFKRAIAETGLNDLGMVFPSLTAAEAIGGAFADTVQCQTAECLRSLDLQTLVSLGPLLPDVDGNVLTQSPDTAFQSGQFNRVPVINGTNHDEYRYFGALIGVDEAITNAGSYENFLQDQFGPLVGNLFSIWYRTPQDFSSPGLAYTTLVTDGFYSCTALGTDQAMSQYVPMYTYEFADENAPPILPAANFPASFPQGSEYYSEAQYLFNLSALGEPTVPLTASQQQLSSTMIRYWTAFAKSGDPNRSGLPVWPSFSGSPAQENFLSLVPPSPVIESEAAFSTDHQCTADRTGVLPPPFGDGWLLYFIPSAQDQ